MNLGDARAGSGGNSEDGPSSLRSPVIGGATIATRSSRCAAAPVTLKGIAVSPGIVIGPAVLIDPHAPRIAHRALAAGEVQSEVDRLGVGLEAARRAAEAAELDARSRLGPQYADILAAHARMIADPSLLRDVGNHIRGEQVDAEQAVSAVLELHARRLEAMAETHPYLAARAADVRDILARILDAFSGGRPQAPWEQWDEPILLFSHDLTPSETAGLDPARVIGFATEAGGIASHTAIVAAALEIPAVVGLGPFLDSVPPCSTAVIDGNEGLVILNPDEATLEYYRQEARKQSRIFHGLSQLVSLPARTTDGTCLQLLGNIEFPEEAQACLKRGAEGIGLYRSEFLYLSSPVPPTEEEQYQAYARVVRDMGGRPVTIRTLDLGADKLTSYAGARIEEKNPFLGLRSLRLSLRDLPLFRTQLRAILRASALGDIRVMFPLVSSVSEFRQAKGILEDVASELIGEGVAVREGLQVGAMIEVPAAVLIADHLARVASFLSIGTNDLVMYALAVDRTNPEVANLFSAADPAVVRLLAMAVEAAAAEQVPVTVCGAMGGDPLYTMLLLGLGLRSLSMPPHQIPVIKRVARAVGQAASRELAIEARGRETAADISALLERALREAAPDVAEAFLPKEHSG